MPNKPPLVAVVLCGGAGTRLWPLSRKMRPKQFIPLLEKGSGKPHATLFEQTMERVKRLGIKDLIIVCHESYRFFVSNHLKNGQNPACMVMTEPVSKNTAPATALAALAALEKHGDVPLLVMPSDHLIGDVSALQASVEKAYHSADQGSLITFGVNPEREETGFGYITTEQARDQDNGLLPVAGFKEKPDAQTVKKLLATGRCYWNSGIFMFKALSYLKALDATHPQIKETCTLAYQRRSQDLDFVKIGMREFEPCREISIDYAVMEHARNLLLAPTDMQWQDLGSWDSLSTVFKKDESGNCTTGGPVLSSSEHNVVYSGDKLLSLLGIKNCIVVNSEDAILVAARDHAQEVKSLVKTLSEQGRSEATEHRKVYRPWGSYETMFESDGFKIKILIINPRQSLSLQSHKHRSEHWVVVQGEAVVTRDDKVYTLKFNQSTYIPAGSKHRIENHTDRPAHVVEVQCGAYLGEDDITRYEDRYGRDQR